MANDWASNFLPDKYGMSLSQTSTAQISYLHMYVYEYKDWARKLWIRNVEPCLDKFYLKYCLLVSYSFIFESLGASRAVYRYLRYIKSSLLKVICQLLGWFVIFAQGAQKQHFDCLMTIWWASSVLHHNHHPKQSKKSNFLVSLGPYIDFSFCLPKCASAHLT